MIDVATITDQPRSMPMTWEQFEQRARAEGIWDDVLDVGVIAGMVGAEAALRDVPLPDWATPMVRAQFQAA